MKVLMVITLAVSLLLVSIPLQAGKVKSKGEIALESRIFQKDDLDLTKDGNLSLFGRIESKYRSGAFRAHLRAFTRVGLVDGDRSIVAVEEAWVGYRKSGWDIRLGMQMLNWSATEAFHPADMINSRLLDSDIENQEKLGEMMLSVKKRIPRGSITLYLMPRYQSPEYPSSKSRLNFLPPDFKVGKTLWLEADGRLAENSTGLQYGARFTQTIGVSDISVHYIRHQDRSQALMLPDFSAGELHPLLLAVRDLGATYSQVLGNWLLKVEYNYRDFINPEEPLPGYTVPIEQPDHHQLAVGLEYGWTYRNGHEATVIFEGQGMLGVNKAQRAQLHAFQRDLLIGYRHAWNDVKSRELLLTVIFDIERKRELLLNLSYKQRLSDTLSIRLGARLIDAPVKGMVPAGLEALHKSNQLYMTLTKYF